jgi:hypothetical protein
VIQQLQKKDSGKLYFKGIVSRDEYFLKMLKIGTLLLTFLILKIVLKAAHECTVYIVHWRKSTSESEGKPEQNFNADFGTIFKNSKGFQRNKQKPYLFFS